MWSIPCMLTLCGYFSQRDKWHFRRWSYSTSRSGSKLWSNWLMWARQRERIKSWTANSYSRMGISWECSFRTSIIYEWISTMNWIETTQRQQRKRVNLGTDELEESKESSSMTQASEMKVMTNHFLSGEGSGRIIRPPPGFPSLKLQREPGSTSSVNTPLTPSPFPHNSPYYYSIPFSAMPG